MKKPTISFVTESIWTKYTAAAIPGSFVFTMLFLPLYAVVAPASGFSLEYQNIGTSQYENKASYYRTVDSTLIDIIIMANGIETLCSVECLGKGEVGYL